MLRIKTDDLPSFTLFALKYLRVYRFFVSRIAEYILQAIKWAKRHILSKPKSRRAVDKLVSELEIEDSNTSRSLASSIRKALKVRYCMKKKKKKKKKPRKKQKKFFHLVGGLKRKAPGIGTPSIFT
jgi:hypothetical protein